MVKFIAEVSSNHAQDLGRSLAFVDCAAECGFDAVKFQLFRVAQLFAPEILAKSPQHSKRVAWELPLEHLEPIARRCREKGVDFSCTPFYLEAVEELEPHVAFYKIASYELLWTDLLKACAADRQAGDHFHRHGDHAGDQGGGRDPGKRRRHATSPSCTASPPILRRRNNRTCRPSTPSAAKPVPRPAGPIIRARPR